MERVTFTFKKNGHSRVMGEKQAALLNKLGHGMYMTRAMFADAAPAFPGTSDGRTVAQVHEHIQQANADDGSSEDSPADAMAELASMDLDAMSKEELHALAAAREIKVHHNAGADKVRAALREAAE